MSTSIFYLYSALFQIRIKRIIIFVTFSFLSRLFVIKITNNRLITQRILFDFNPDQRSAKRFASLLQHLQLTVVVIIRLNPLSYINYHNNINYGLNAWAINCSFIIV